MVAPAPSEAVDSTVVVASAEAVASAEVAEAQAVEAPADDSDKIATKKQKALRCFSDSFAFFLCFFSCIFKQNM